VQFLIAQLEHAPKTSSVSLIAHCGTDHFNAGRERRHTDPTVQGA
jgi:hypothetical protein